LENPPSPDAVTQGQHRGLDVAIVGAGVSGLAVALALCRSKDAARQLASVTIFDAAPRVGGVLGHKRHSGYLCEGAAQGVLASRERFLELALECGLEPSLRPSPRRLSRFLILPEGFRLAPVGPNLWNLWRQGVLSWRGLLRALREPFVPKHGGAVQETFYEFLTRRFGAEVAQRLGVPMSTGIWAGGAKRLLVRHVMPRLLSLELDHGSVIKGLLRTAWVMLRQRLSKATRTPARYKGLLTFEQGMQTFAQGLHARAIAYADEHGVQLKTRLGTRVHSCVFADASNATMGSQFVLRTAACTASNAAPDRTLDESRFDAVFTSVPLWREQLDFVDHQNDDRAPLAKELLAILANTPSHGLVVVGIGGKDGIAPPQGFGALAPAESPDLLGVLYAHSLVPEHAPPGHFLYRVLLGGDRDPSFVGLAESVCIERATHWLRELGLVTSKAQIEFSAVFKWPGVIPLQDEGQDERLRAAGQLELLFPGLYFVGNYLHGVGVFDCLVSADDAVARCFRELTQTNPTAPSQKQDAL
jgi:oxygen-dependent protoporphyrinogen oxidase